MSQIFQAHQKEVLEALVRLSGSNDFQKIVAWFAEAKERAISMNLAHGDDVTRGHAQALVELLEHVNSARTELTKQQGS